VLTAQMAAPRHAATRTAPPRRALPPRSWYRASRRSSPSPRARAASANRRRAVNLALASPTNGLKVGILDADIYGPSMRACSGISGKPNSRRRPGPRADAELRRKMQCRMGFLVAEDTPMIWRGPMVMSALNQMLRDVNLGRARHPCRRPAAGTGDAQLTMAQQVPLSGAVIVSTPQDIALLDARKVSTCSARSTCRYSASSRT